PTASPFCRTPSGTPVSGSRNSSHHETCSPAFLPEPDPLGSYPSPVPFGSPSPPKPCRTTHDPSNPSSPDGIRRGSLPSSFPHPCRTTNFRRAIGRTRGPALRLSWVEAGWPPRLSERPRL